MLKLRCFPVVFLAATLIAIGAEARGKPQPKRSKVNQCKTAKSQGLDKAEKAELSLIEAQQSKEAKFWNQWLKDSNEKPIVEEYVVTLKTNGNDVPIKAKRYRSTKTPSKGTVIQLCGGPSPCMNFRPQQVPEEYDVVTFDYIGLGENKLAPAPPELMSVEGQALATKKIIGAFKLKDYVIHGGSFGTMVATETAAIINSDPSFPQPKAVILEGTHAGQLKQNFPAAAEKAWKLLSSKEKKAFEETYKRVTKTMTPEEIDNEIDVPLSGVLALGSEESAQALRDFVTKNANGFKKSEVPFIISDDDPMYKRMYQAAGCQLRDPKAQGQEPGKLFGGLVTNPYFAGNNSVCLCRTIDRDFDSKKFQITSPILYINGDADPFTPIDGAKKHMQGQVSTSMKKMITVIGGGHFPTVGALKDCRDVIFSAAMKGDISALGGTFVTGQNCADENPPRINSVPAEALEGQR